MKKCPFCAETIKAEAIRCKHCGADLAAGKSSKGFADFANYSPPPANVAACAKCNYQLVAKEKKNLVSIAGLLSVVVFLFGIGVAFVNIIAGVLVMIFALILGATGRGSKTVMVCPQCGAEGRRI